MSENKHTNHRDTEDARYDHMLSGYVVDNNDPLKIGRVRVNVSGLLEPESLWAFPMGRMFGVSNGIHWVPEVGSNVVVFLNQGDVDHPYYIAGPWGKPDGVQDIPNTAPNGDVNIMAIQWRNSSIVMDGTPGAEKITIQDLAIGTKLEIDRTTKNFTKTILGSEISTIELNKTKTVKGDNTETTTGTYKRTSGNEEIAYGTSEETGTTLKKITAPIISLEAGGAISIVGGGLVNISGAGVSLSSSAAGSSNMTGLQTETFQGGLLRSITGTFIQTISGAVTWTFNGLTRFLGAAIEIGNGPYKSLVTEDHLDGYDGHFHVDSNGLATGPPTVLSRQSGTDITSHLKAS